MMYLLDTNACIVYLNGRSIDVRNRLNSCGDDRIAICSVVKAELLYGAAKSQSPEKAVSAINRFSNRFASFSFDDAAAGAYGPLRASLEKMGTVIGSHDMLIASIAIANGFTLVTHNTKEFKRVPNLILEDWEEGNSRLPR